MGLVGLAPAIVVAALAAAPAAAPSGNPAPSAPLFTRQTLFSIPFRMDARDPGSRDVVEVQLYVSTNGGVTWRLYSRGEPQRGNFLFRAGGDGEYWFLLRTVDRAGKTRPETASQPGLRVIVDTVAPQMTLDARLGKNGQVSARWQIMDAHLNAQSLRIQYRTGADQAWQTVAIDRQRASGSGSSQTGEVSWWPQEPFERLEIRGEVSDLAGNTAVNHAQVGPGAHPASGAAAGGGLELNPPAPRSGPPLTAPQNGPRGRPAAAPGEGAVAIQIHPASGNRSVPSSPSSGNLAPELVPPGQRLRMVNSLRFELHCELPPAALSAKTVVEVWGTRDGGQTWTNLGPDEDRRSPFLVTVPEEGVYGFRLAVRDTAGPGPAPSAGSPAELWVGVDLTKPKARLVAVQPVAGPQSGQLDIRWEAEDRMLAPRPASLSYAPTPSGPWTAVATGLENTGRYTWWMDGRVPEQIYLRLEVRDEAGNVGSFVTPSPIAVDPRHAPLRIREARPVAGPARSN